jgi:hypothetical protein
MEKEGDGLRHHMLAFWIGAGMAMTGLLIVARAGLTALGRNNMPSVRTSAAGGGLVASDVFGLALVVASFVMFAIAWHLAGRQAGGDKPS